MSIIVIVPLCQSIDYDGLVQAPFIRVNSPANYTNWADFIATYPTNEEQLDILGLTGRLLTPDYNKTQSLTNPSRPIVSVFEHGFLTQKIYPHIPAEHVPFYGASPPNHLIGHPHEIWFDPDNYFYHINPNHARAHIREIMQAEASTLRSAPFESGGKMWPHDVAAQIDRLTAHTADTHSAFQLPDTEQEPQDVSQEEAQRILRRSIAITHRRQGDVGHAVAQVKADYLDKTGVEFNRISHELYHANGEPTERLLDYFSNAHTRIIGVDEARIEANALIREEKNRQIHGDATYLPSIRFPNTILHPSGRVENVDWTLREEDVLGLQQKNAEYRGGGGDLEDRQQTIWGIRQLDGSYLQVQVDNARQPTLRDIMDSGRARIAWLKGSFTVIINDLMAATTIEDIEAVKTAAITHLQQKWYAGIPRYQAGSATTT